VESQSLPGCRQSDARARRAAITHTILGNYLLAGFEPSRSLRDVLAKLAAG